MTETPDDPGIPNESALWRRIPPQWVIPDENLGRSRPSSAAFQNSSTDGHMSVSLADIVKQTERNEMDVLAMFPDFSLAGFSAEFARSCKQGVIRDPLPDEPAHAGVTGKKTGSIRKRFAREAEWVVLRQDAAKPD